ncbi:MAG TPA: GNAT family N-acetyltransferase [Acidimicrobiales bacterium]|nr:GNAT family N-acetyltransferase [Acidimicrobiales bacterium]
MGGIAGEAAVSSERWASKAGVEIELVDSEGAARELVTVLSRVWPQPDGSQPFPPELAWALAHSGNYVALARTEDGPVAAAVAFRGRDADGVHLHSHMVGVVADHQGANIGFALKQHQRAWALDQDLARITWTFDPLLVRNAYFNVMKLGARLTRYYVDFYGELTDGINAGDETDRCLVTWWLTEDRAVRASAGEVPSSDRGALLASGAVKVLGPDATGAPEPSADCVAPVRLVCVPADAVDVRRTDPGRSREWRHALRTVLRDAFDAGLEVTAVSRDGCYVLSADG